MREQALATAVVMQAILDIEAMKKYDERLGLRPGSQEQRELVYGGSWESDSPQGRYRSVYYNGMDAALFMVGLHTHQEIRAFWTAAAGLTKGTLTERVAQFYPELFAHLERMRGQINCAPLV